MHDPISDCDYRIRTLEKTPEKKMSQFRYIAFIDHEKIRGFHSKIELDHWMKDKPDATFVRYSVKREPKEKLDLDQFEPAPF